MSELVLPFLRDNAYAAIDAQMQMRKILDTVIIKELKKLDTKSNAPNA